MVIQINNNSPLPFVPTVQLLGADRRSPGGRLQSRLSTFNVKLFFCSVSFVIRMSIRMYIKLYLHIQIYRP
jgi:hypothetical protein